MAVFGGCGCRGKGGCLLLVIVSIVAIILLSGIGYKFFSDSIYTNLLKEFGFESEQEYNEFSDKMNEPFDDTDILIDMPTSTDGEISKAVLSSSLQLSNGENVILDNGKLNLESMQNTGDVVLSSDMEFTSQQFAYAINLFLTSSTSDDEVELAQDIQLKQIDYQYLNDSSAKFNFYLDIDSSDIGKAMGKLGKFVPERLLFNIAVTLTNESDKLVASDCDIAINKLDEETTANFLNILAILMDKSVVELKQWIGDTIAVLFNEFNTGLDCKFVFSNDIITITKVV